MSEPKQFTVKTREQIRDDYTRTVKAGLEKAGIPNVNVSAGTLDYVRGDALGAFGEDLGNLVQIKANAQLPDSAGKDDPDDLTRLTRIHGLGLRSAGPSIGPIVLSTAVAFPVVIPEGAQLIDSAGLSYETLSTAPYSNGEAVQIRAVDTGSETNLEQGTVLRWVSPPPFVSQTALVGQGGLVGGVDAEDVEGLRVRFLDYYRNPPKGGNWAQVALTAENSSTAVSKAFVYPGVYGGNTMHVVVLRAPTTTNKARTVPDLELALRIIPAVVSAFPTFADIVVTSADSFALDLSLSLSIPTSKKASAPGPGGGWFDGTPWPTPLPGDSFARVVTVNGATDLVIRATGAPVVGGRIAYVSPYDFRLYRGVIQTVDQPDPLGFPNDWRVTLDVGFFYNRLVGSAILSGAWVFPDAERMAEYVAAVFAAYAELGPGEKTNSPGLVPRSLRKPGRTYAFPIDLTGFVLRRVILSGDEVNDVAFLEPVLSVPVVDGYKLPPFVGVPNQLAFYPME